MKKLFYRQPKLLICIELKLAEILGVCGIVVIMYGMGYFVTRIMGVAAHMDLWYEIIAMGFLPLSMLLGIFMLSIGIYEIIKANWAWAERLKNKHKYP